MKSLKMVQAEAHTPLWNTVSEYLSSFCLCCLYKTDIKQTFEITGLAEWAKVTLLYTCCSLSSLKHDSICGMWKELAMNKQQTPGLK